MGRPWGVPTGDNTGPRRGDAGPPGSNVGVANTGAGTVNVHGSAVGSQVNNTWAVAPADRREPSPDAGPRADVGVLTVLHQEMRAVVEVLRLAPGYQTYQIYGGAQVHEAKVPADGGPLRVVAMQAVDRGPRSAALAYQRMREQFGPALVLLVGIAGGIGRVEIGDVVISDEVIYYDARRETPDGIRRRGQSQSVTSVLRNRLNEFFRLYGDSIQVNSTTSVGVHLGPIGSGDAVITDGDSNIRRYLADFNEKTLAVETEAAGLAQAFHEEVQSGQGLRGWLTIRGISDHADKHKGHDSHQLAANHAAAIMAHLLPLLRLATAPE